MKKVVLPIISLLLILTFGNINAQTNISIGARAGLNIASLSFDPDIAGGINKSSRTGFKFGGALEIGFAPMFALQIEPMYSQGGCVLDNVSFGFTNGKVTFKVSYIEIPILFKVKIPVQGSVTPYAFVGPNLGLVLSANQLSEGGGQSQETDIKDQTTSMVFALDFGAGAGIKVAPLTTVIIDVRYSLGLSSVLNDKGKQVSGFNSVKSNGFQIVAGVMFGL